MSNALERFEDALREAGKTTDGRGMWQCPAHEDRTPSLSVKRGDKGAVVHCFAGCEPAAIVEAMGLNASDLFDEPLSTNGAPARPPLRPKLVAEYRFTDRHGEPLSTHERWEPGKCGKRPKSFVWTNGNPHVLYNLPLVVEAEHVHVNEGGKAADALNKVLLEGHVATYPPVTSEEWESSFTDCLIDTTVTIWMDRDEPGREFAAKVYSALTEAGVKASIVQSKTTAAKDDAYDHLAAGFAVEDAVAVTPEELSASEEDDSATEKTISPYLISLADVKPEAIEWLWPGYIPKAKITDVIGDGDMGKSLVLLDIAARLTRGNPMPDGFGGGEPSNVVLLVAEDDLADTVVPRLIAAGADLSRISALEGPMQGVDTPIVFPDDMPAVEATIRDTNAKLLIIDPVMAFLGSGVRSGIDAEVRVSLMGPLKSIASRHDCAVLSLRHTNKAEGSSASMRGGGSVAFRNASRAGLAFGPDHEDEDGMRRIMVQSKKNLSRGHPALAYHIESSFKLVDVEGSEGTPIIVWEGIAEGATASSVLGPAPKEPAPREGTKTDEATQWLKSRLAGGVEVTAKAMIEEGGKMGFTRGVITKARRYADVQSERISKGNTGEGHSLWYIEEE